MDKKRLFWRGFFSALVFMAFLTLCALPLGLWISGIWSAWSILSYFITIPAYVGFINMTDE